MLKRLCQIEYITGYMVTVGLAEMSKLILSSRRNGDVFITGKHSNIGI